MTPARPTGAPGPLAAALALALVSCSGHIGDAGPAAGESVEAPPAPRRPAADAPAGPPGGGPPSALPAAAPGACGAVDPGFVGLRRLTRPELDNAYRDLLGDTTRPAGALPDEDSVLAEQATLSPLAFEKLEAITDRLVEEAWAREQTGRQPAAARLQICPLRAGDAACARAIVAAFARKAFRRPVAAADLDPLHAFITLATARGDDLAVGVKLALKATLLAPEFLYRVEASAPGAPVRPLTAHELAARLSFWLWGSVPDAALSALADAGALTRPATLQAEVARLLADPRAAAFAESFTDLWLGLYALEAARPDPVVHKGFDDRLRASMHEETRRFARAFIAETRPLGQLMDADFTFVDERLARHYGLPAPAGAATELREVKLPAGPRRGLLGQASILTMTSAATRTSPVKRGKWIYSKALCGHMPPPPPDAEALSPAARDARTERERLELHRTSPACNACHVILDPLGLGLETFDGIGRHRTRYPNGLAIDPAGVLPGGATFATFEELRGLLKEDPRVPGCVTEKMFLVAVGRELATDADECVRRAIVDAVVAGQGGVRDVIFALASSPVFLTRRGEPAGGTP
jgi:hypothetical protein